MGVSVLSYGGEVRVGIATDARVCAAPQEIVEMVERELGVIMAKARNRQGPLTQSQERPQLQLP
jgi:hypothetical protein